MAPGKKNLEEIRRKKKECERRRRERIKSNPELYEQAKAKERARYRKRKEEKKILPVDEISDRRKRKQRKEWRKRQKICRENRKRRERFLSRLRADSPPSSSTDFESVSVRNSPIALRINSPTDSNRRSRSFSSHHSSCQRDISPSTLENFSPRILESPSNSSTSSYQKQIGLRIAKRNRYILNKKLKLQEKMISNLKKSLNALQNTKKGEKESTNLERKEHTQEKQHCEQKTVKNLKTIRGKKVAIEKFFESDENTRLMPGKRDVITRNKVKKQKRLLNDSLGNLYKKFLAENPCEMSFATFCRLKPFWVLQASVAKRDTCLCVLHENLNFIVEKLHYLHIIPNCSIDEIAKRVLCDIKFDRCVLRQCNECRDKVPKVNTFTDSPTYYKKWIVKKEPRTINGKEKMIKRTVKDTIHIAKVDLVKLLIELIPKFLIHKQIITNQYEYINDLKKNLDVGEVLLHIDFSENYQTKYSQEIQSVHFGASRQQLTLHTVVAYFRDLISNQVVTRSFCTLSESLRHDACAVYAHILPVLHEINKRTPIHSLHFLSDAPSTQYRNKCMMYIFSNLLPKVFNLRKAERSYSAPGHGKGAPDGVGGYTKRTADRIVSQGKDITDVQTLFQVLCSQESNITYILVHESDIKQVDSIVPKNLKPIRGTMNTYQVCWSKEEDNTIFLRRLSCSNCEKDCPHYGIGKYTYKRSDTDEECLPGSSHDNIAYRLPENNVTTTQEFLPGTSDDIPTGMSKNTLTSIQETNTSNGSHNESLLASNRELIEGNWAVIKFVCKKTEVFYIGQIISVLDSKYLITFLRKKKIDDEYSEFVWPQCEDISEVNDEDIIATLPQPYCGRRNVTYFRNNLLSSFHNLR